MKYARGRLGRHHPAAPSRARPGGLFSGRHFFAFETLEDRRLLSAAPSTETLPNLIAEPLVQRLPTFSATPATGTASPNGLTPAQIRHAYGFDLITLNGGIVGDGSGQTIAIVNAYHNPNIVQNLIDFDAAFGIPAPPSFVRVSQTGSTTLPTGTNSTWALETALDVEWAHALAPGANIILVECASPGSNDLFAGIDWARRQPGVVAVSMSFGFGESLMTSGQEASFDAYFTTPAGSAGVTFLGASGDIGAPGLYPAVSENVLAIGGTQLTLDTQANNYNYLSEAGWSGSGGSESLYEPLQSYQAPFVPPGTTHRMMPDVAFNASGASGVAVYDIFSNGAGTGWSVVGGTSFSTPAWAALVAIVDQGRTLNGLEPYDGASELLPAVYGLPNSAFHDITTGSNNGGPVNLGPGYDTVTGRGTPIANLVVAGLVGSGTISGKVFNDVNGNATFDSEPGLTGWTVYEDANNNSSFDVSTPHAYSNNNSFTVNSFTTANSNIVVPLTGNILDVNVTFNITHARGSDLIATLTNSLSGVSITLLSRVLGSTGSIQVTLDDAAIASIIGASGSSITGTLQPAMPLSMFNGTSPTGTWTLSVSDAVVGQSGTLQSWSMQITTGDPSTLSDANGNYQFPGLVAGNYKIGEVLQPGATRTLPVSGFYNVALASMGNVTGQDFGNQLPPSTPPGGVVLLAASDSGAANNDGITKFSSALQFQVTGTIAGAMVYVLANGNVIGSALASGVTTTVTSNVNLADGTYALTASQTEANKASSAPVAGLSLQIDTVAPVASITPVSPNPRTTAVGQMTITFAEPVSGLDLADLQLTRDGGPNLLAGQTLTTGDNGLTWTLDSLLGITAAAGFYQLDVTLAGAPIVDTAGNAETATTSSTFTVGSAVASRLLFYNQSFFDGSNAAIDASDDSAIAPDKTAYRAGDGLAVSANLSTYTRGINGIIVDLLGAGSHTSISASDFVFKFGNNNTPSGWSTAADPSSVSVRAGQGAGGSDRVEIIWGANAVKNAWLEVQVLANSNTGLSANDVFFWGSLPGDASLNFATNGADGLQAINNQTTTNGAGLSNVRDFNRNGTVSPTDGLTAINNQTSLLKINITGGPFAPDAAGPSGPQAVPQAVPHISPQATPQTVAKTSLAGTPALSATTISAAPESKRTAAVAIESLIATNTNSDTTRPNDRDQPRHDDARVTFGLSLAASASRGSNANDLSGLVDENLLELLVVGRRHGSLRRR